VHDKRYGRRAKPIRGKWIGFVGKCASNGVQTAQEEKNKGGLSHERTSQSFVVSDPSMLVSVSRGCHRRPLRKGLPDFREEISVPETVNCA
jgi:hypothetical protein